jgi:hypothetical protein
MLRDIMTATYKWGRVRVRYFLFEAGQVLVSLAEGLLVPIQELTEMRIDGVPYRWDEAGNRLVQLWAR